MRSSRLLMLTKMSDKLKTSLFHEYASMLDPSTKAWICKEKGVEYVQQSLLTLVATSEKDIVKNLMLLRLKKNL